jgi:hypothetical protein
MPTSRPTGFRRRSHTTNHAWRAIGTHASRQRTATAPTASHTGSSPFSQARHQRAAYLPVQPRWRAACVSNCGPDACCKHAITRKASTRFHTSKLAHRFSNLVTRQTTLMHKQKNIACEPYRPPLLQYKSINAFG